MSYSEEDKRLQDSPRFIVHIGLQKCASSFLQSSIFPWILGIDGNQNPSLKVSLPKALDQINSWKLYNRDNNIYNNNSAFFVSQESLSGIIADNHPGDSWSRFINFLNIVNGLEEKIAVIIVLRNQTEWLRSAWLEVIKNGRSIDNFEQFLNRFNEIDLSWYERLKHLQRFHVVPFFLNELKRYPKETALEISQLFYNYGLSQHSRPYNELSMERENSYVNLTAQTKAEINAALIFNKTKMHRNKLRKILPKFITKTWIFGNHDAYIRFARNKFSNSKKVECIIPREIEAYLIEDWKYTVKLVQEIRTPKTNQ